MKKWLKTVPALMVAFSGSALAQQLNTLSEVEKQEGFKLLFSGTLQSFKDNFVDYQKNNPNTTSLSSVWQFDAANSAIITRSNSGDIRSKAQYADFDLRMDYRNSGNQGLFYRFTLQYNTPYESGVELAIDNRTTLCHTCAGAAYELYSPTKNVYQPYATGKWNSLRLVVIKDSVEHWLNGEKIVGYKFHSSDYWSKYNLSKWNSASTMSFKVPGDRNGGYINNGYIGFQGNHGGEWNIRNFRITTTNPYFGPVKTVTPTKIGASSKAPKLSYTMAREATGDISLSFGNGPVLEASLVSLDGKAILPGRLVEGGSKVSFSAVPKTGVYFLQARTAAGNITQKLNIL